MFPSCLKGLGKHLGESGEGSEEAGGREGEREDKSPSVEAGGRLEGGSRWREGREGRRKPGWRESSNCGYQTNIYKLLKYKLLFIT